MGGTVKYLVILLSLSVGHWPAYSQRLKKTEVIVQNQKDCDSAFTHELYNSLQQYEVTFDWAKPTQTCSSEKGFFCGQHFIQKENFANLGTRLCIDIQGVQFDIQRMNQLLITVFDRGENLKKVYSITRLMPEDSPYYVCSSSSISVSLSVRPSVEMCPSILNYFYNNKIRLGTVSARPVNPITELNLANCEMSNLPVSDSNLLKISAYGMLSECTKTKVLQQSFTHMRACVSLVHFSSDYQCNFVTRLFSQGGDKSNMIEFSMDERYVGDTKLCENFQGRYGHLVLTIQAYPQSSQTCLGNFAFRVDFRQISPPDDDDKEDGESGTAPNLYMAVFITLIAICLVCLGLTCLCCVRFRAKRLRRLQQRNSRRQGRVLNQGFQHDGIGGVDGGVGGLPYDGVLWSPAQPAMLHGLPSYEDVVGHNSGVNPSDDSIKNEPPPAYEAVCSSTSES